MPDKENSDGEADPRTCLRRQHIAFGALPHLDGDDDVLGGEAYGEGEQEWAHARRGLVTSGLGGQVKGASSHEQRPP